MLSSQIATFFPNLELPNKIAFEYDIFGDFACDLAIGSPDQKNYCFVEFEDAQRQSLFKKESKFKPSFGTRLEHGHSQVIDWFNKIDNLQNTNDMEERFGSRTIDFYGILIIGRSKFLNDTLTNRLNWRSDNIFIKQKTINILTFDGLLEALKTKLDTIESYKNSIL